MMARIRHSAMDMSAAQWASPMLLSLQDAQRMLPGRPTTRWIAAEAKRLGCARRIGRILYIPSQCWARFIQGQTLQSEGKANGREPKSKAKTAPPVDCTLQEALSLAQAKRPKSDR